MPYGSIILLGIIFYSCAKLEYVHKVDWVYVNESSHNIKIEGIVHFTHYVEFNFNVQKEDIHVIQYQGEGEKNTKPEYFPLPSFKEDCKLLTNGSEFKISEGKSIWNRNNYIVEELGFNYYKFTYTFTDKNIAELKE